MKMKLVALLACSLLAASSFAQSSSLNTASMETEAALTDMMQGSAEKEIAVLPLVAAVAVAVAVTEVLHHHGTVEDRPTSNPSKETTEALFDR